MLRLEAEFGESWIEFTRYPFRTASVRRRPRLEASQIAAVDPEGLPPCVLTDAGEVLFIQAGQKEELREFARRNALEVAHGGDAWGLLLEPFLDTEFSWPEIRRTYLALERCGIDGFEAARIRDRVGPRTLMVNAVLWEWNHLGLFDLLLFSSGFGGLPFTPRPAFSRWAMEIARRGYAAQVEPRADVGPGETLPALADRTVRATGLAAERVLPLLEELKALYRSEGRRYHDLAHLEEIVSFVLAEPRWKALPPGLARATLWAAWFHDAVYAPMARDNEQRSADLAEARLAALGVAPDEREAVVRLILLTRDHARAQAPEEQLLADADCAVWAASPTRYLLYADGIRREYQAVPLWKYALGRGRFLRSALRQARKRGGRVFFGLGAELEARALANLQAELRLLRPLRVLHRCLLGADWIW